MIDRVDEAVADPLRQALRSQAMCGLVQQNMGVYRPREQFEAQAAEL